MSFRKKCFITLLILLAMYILIFAARTVYVFTSDTPLELVPSSSSVYSNLSSNRSFQNYASEKRVYDGLSGTQVLSQKYERIASISTRTTSFDADLAHVNKAIADAQAVVQLNNEQGLPGNRRLTRAIGVRPENYDACLDTLKSIGTLVSSTSQTTDMTYEYNQMLAQKQELEKRLESYKALRSHEGAVYEKISLEDKIIEVESQLLRQAVDLGEYSDENALCTINITLIETGNVRIAVKIGEAFRWTNSFYFPMLGGAVTFALAAIVFVKAYGLVAMLAKNIIDKKRKDKS